MASSLESIETPEHFTLNSEAESLRQSKVPIWEAENERLKFSLSCKALGKQPPRRERPFTGKVKTSLKTV